MGSAPSSCGGGSEIGASGPGSPGGCFPTLSGYCATKWACNLGNPYLLMDLMGWSNPDVAIVYVRSTGRGLEEAVMTWNGNGHNRGPVPSPGSARLS